MLLATVCGSWLLNSAVCALVLGSDWLVGGAPGAGGRRLKSGGMTSGALVVTANSSGDFLVRPAASRRSPQPAAIGRQSSSAGTASVAGISRFTGTHFMSHLMAFPMLLADRPGKIAPYVLLLGMFRSQHIVDDRCRAERNRQV